MDNYIQLPSSVDSEILSLVTKKREEEKVFQFLMELNDTIYGTVRSNTIQQEPVPKVKMVLARIRKEEQHKNVSRSTVDEYNGDAVAFAVGKPLQ